MKTNKPYLSVLAVSMFLLLGTSTVQAQHHDHQGGMHQMTEEGITHPTLIDGVQVVEVTVTPAGYSVDRILLQPGVPVRLVFTRTEEGGCTQRVQIPHFGIAPTDLPLNEPTALEFTPTEGGEFTFACGMDMIKGILVVKTS